MAVCKVVFKCDGCGNILDCSAEQIMMMFDNEQKMGFLRPKDWLSKYHQGKMYSACSRSCACVISMKHGIDYGEVFK